MQVLGFIQPPLGRLERLRLRAHVLRAPKLGRNVIESSNGEGGEGAEKLTGISFAPFLDRTRFDFDTLLIKDQFWFEYLQHI